MDGYIVLSTMSSYDLETWEISLSPKGKWNINYYIFTMETKI